MLIFDYNVWKGQNCEKDVQITMPYFSEESFISFQRPKHILRALKLSFRFKAEDVKDGILVSSFEISNLAEKQFCHLV